jgi:hypothetical protein
MSIPAVLLKLSRAKANTLGSHANFLADQHTFHTFQ